MDAHTVIGSEQAQEFIDREFGVAQNLSEEAASKIVRAVFGDRDDPPISMAQPHMAPSLADALKSST